MDRPGAGRSTSKPAHAGACTADAYNQALATFQGKVDAANATAEAERQAQAQQAAQQAALDDAVRSAASAVQQSLSAAERQPRLRPSHGDGLRLIETSERLGLDSHHLAIVSASWAQPM